MKVLVVDDSRTMRRVIIRYLSQINIHDTLEARDGFEALSQLLKLHEENSQVDLVLTDWNMPSMTGLDFVKAVRARDFLAKVPIIMITSNSAKSDVVAAMGAGIDSYIMKPFNTQILQEAIIDTLKKFHSRTENKSSSEPGHL